MTYCFGSGRELLDRGLEASESHYSHMHGPPRINIHNCIRTNLPSYCYLTVLSVVDHSIRLTLRVNFRYGLMGDIHRLQSPRQFLLRRTSSGNTSYSMSIDAPSKKGSALFTIQGVQLLNSFRNRSLYVCFIPHNVTARSSTPL